MNIAWSPEAIEDLASLRAYIAEDDPGAARAGRVPGTRELVIPRTPYIVPYRLQNQTIQILRVSRRPALA